MLLQECLPLSKSRRNINTFSERLWPNAPPSENVKIAVVEKRLDANVDSRSSEGIEELVDAVPTAGADSGILGKIGDLHRG